MQHPSGVRGWVPDCHNIARVVWIKLYYISVGIDVVNLTINKIVDSLKGYDKISCRAGSANFLLMP